MADSLALLFTDIEGSTRLLDRLGERYADLLAQHHRVIRKAIAAAGGREVHGEGDSFLAVFPRAGDAVECARAAQLALREPEWPEGNVPRVRMGIHTGTAELWDGDLVGMDVHVAARVMAVAYGGQVLLTEATRRALGSSTRLRDLGHHRLKDLPDPERLFQLLAPGLREDFPPLRSLNRSNLQTPAHRLVGRRRELAMALELLEREDVRLLTLVGPGGAGKTRLALEIATEAVSRYRDGVWIVPLAPIADPELMVPEIARVLEIASVPGEALEQTLARALAERELLLVLDNFEHLMAAAHGVAALLAPAPRLDLLVTSREPLRIRAEQRLEVPPLPVEEARELFVQRALAVRPELDIDAEENAAIERVCTRLDGLPLALELAAARISVFAPRALEARLSGGMTLPEGARDLPDRQRTLRGTIEWSYRLLDPPERTLLQLLGPFLGGVRADHAEAVFDGVVSDVLQSLVSLVEKSLLRRREDLDGEPRFWLLETIRAFALEQAAADGLAEDAADRHAEHFLRLSDQAVAEMFGRDHRNWVEPLERDHPNLRGALAHLLGNTASEAMRLAANLMWFWDVRGDLREAHRWLTEALQRAPDNSPGRALALFGAARMALELGQPVEGHALAGEALSMARRDGDRRVEVLALSHLGWATVTLGEHERGAAYHRQAIALARAAPDDWALAFALNNYAVQTDLGKDVDRARVLVEESLKIRRRLGEPRGIAIAACNLAEIVTAAGELKRAEELIGEALTHAREIAHRGMVAMALSIRAEIALVRDDSETAHALLLEATAMVNATNDVQLAEGLLSTGGTLAAIAGESSRAAMLWAAGDCVRARTQAVDSPTSAQLRTRWEPGARRMLGTAQWDAAYAAGAAMPLDDALTLLTAP